MACPFDDPLSLFSGHGFCFFLFCLFLCFCLRARMVWSRVTVSSFVNPLCGAVSFF